MIYDLKNYRNYLFHYTRWDTAKNHIFKNDEIRFSPFSLLDDPREYKDWNFYVLQRSFLGRSYNEKITKKANDIIKNKFKVLCFTETSKLEPDIIHKTYHDKNDRYKLMFSMGYAKSRMWSQYGYELENCERKKIPHAGICLIFDKKKLLSFIRRKYPVSFSGPVKYRNYSERFLKARKIRIDRIWTDENKINEIVKEHIKQNRQPLLFEKNKDYRDESEYRVIIFSEDADYEHIPIKDFLCGAIVNDKYRGRLYDFKEFEKYSGLELGRLSWQDGRPVYTAKGM